MLGFPLSALEKMINTVIRLDPETQERLKDLGGGSVELIIEDWKINFFIVLTADGVELHRQFFHVSSSSLK